VPLVLLEPSALRLPPGCTPPPAALNLAEQLLRAAPTPSTVLLAVKMLEGCVSEVTAGRALPPEQQGGPSQPQQESGAEVDAQQAASAELHRLAFVSLCSSVAQAMVCHCSSWQDESCQQVMELAVNLMGAACKEAASSSSWNSSCGGDSSSILQEAGKRSVSKSVCWTLAASLAAVAAVGGYTAHLGPVAAGACTAAEVGPHADASSTQAASGSTSGGSAEGASRQGPAEGSLATAHSCPEGCVACGTATVLFRGLRYLECGVVPSEGLAAAGVAAAQHRGTSWRQHLRQQMLELAWRHPVPGVCGNVLCERLEGTAAVGVVRGRVGTLCGRCRAASYCCVECQHAAWEAHRAVCVRRPRGVWW
jgi:hypothetical protein